MFTTKILKNMAPYKLTLLEDMLAVLQAIQHGNLATVHEQVELGRGDNKL